MNIWASIRLIWYMSLDMWELVAVYWVVWRVGTVYWGGHMIYMRHDMYVC